MFRRQKSPVISETHCNEMESLRMALEVMFGQRVRFHNIDFNTGRGMVRLGEEEKRFSFFSDRPEMLNFSLWNEVGEPNKEWYSALFFEKRDDRPEEVRVLKDVNPNWHGRFVLSWTGRSYTERREEPLWKEKIEEDAAVCGVSYEEYLNS